MDQAYELGLNFVPDSTTTARLVNTNTMATARQTFAPHLANIAWTLAGEPDLYSFPFFVISPANLIAQYTVAKAQSPLPLLALLSAWPRTTLPPFLPIMARSGYLDGGALRLGLQHHRFSPSIFSIRSKPGPSGSRRTTSGL